MSLDSIFSHVDSHQDEYVSRLSECVAIPGVSASPERRGDVVRTMEWAHGWAKKLDATFTQLVPLGTQTMSDGQELPLPPVLLAQWGDDPSKKTLVIYGHLDVQPAALEDGWNTDPWVLTEVDGKLFGRGSTDDKGPVLGWLWVIEAHAAAGKDLPVNIRCVFEGMEESGSVGLAELVRSLGKPGEFLDPSVVDAICISDNYFLGKTKPCVTYGLRGNCYYHLAVECSTKDLHSGVMGGVVHEAMVDLVALLSSLVDSETGAIRIEGIMDDVAPITEAEEESYRTIDFSPEQFKVDAGVDTVSGKLIYSQKRDILMHRWRYPTCTIHGIEGAFAGPGSKTVIPRRVVGKFSLRIVPNMHPDRVDECVRAHIDRAWARLCSPNNMSLTRDKASLPWYRDPSTPNFAAARSAVKRVHGIEPDLTREGGSIPITLVFEEACQADCVLLPMGACDDMAHSQNEKLDRNNYINGIKVFAAYLENLSKML